jgi:hypothetical protein
MPKLLRTSLSNRRLLAIAAVGAVLAAYVLIQGTALRGVAASPKPQAALANCTSADIRADQGQPMQPVVKVTLEAFSTACVSPQYRYMVLAPGTSTWVYKTGYTTSATYVWNTIGAQLGVWQIGIWARESGSTARYNAYAIRTFIIGWQFCAGAVIYANPLDPQTAGTSVTITASAIDCPFPTFEFWEMAPGASTWSLVAPYNQAVQGVTTASRTWDTTGLAPGAYRWAAWVREGGSPHRYDTYALMTYWIT